MYRPSDIQTGLLNLWGWRQHKNTSDFTLSNSLTASSSGQYYQDVHPMLTLDNIKSVAPDFEEVTPDAWAAETQYRIGDRVSHSGENYVAIVDTIGQDPENTPAAWDRFDSFSEWLEEKTKASILNAIRKFWDDKMSSMSAKNILENKTLFDGTGRITDTITTGSNYVGFEITPIRANGVTTKIEKIGLQMTGTQSITIYLMHSSQSTPVKSQELTRTKAGSMQWFDLTDWYLPYMSENTDAGGSWYLIYDQTDLGAEQAINKTKDWSKKPCGSCNANESANYNIWSKYLEVHPFKVSGVDSDNPALWDIADNLYTYTHNYGINLQISIECDVTDLIISQKNAFQSIIGLQLATDMLREFAYNPNFKIGRAQQHFSRQEILYELDGDSQSYKKSGIKHDLNAAMKAVSLDVTKLSRVCFPCGRKGVRFRTV